MSGRARRCWAGCSQRAAKEPTLFGFDFSFAPPIDRARRISARRAGRSQRPRANSGPMSTRRSRRRRPRRRELPRDRAPPAFLFRHRRRGEGRLRALPPVRRTRSTRRAAARPPAPMTRSAPRRSPRRASPACACFTGSTARSRSGRWTRCRRAAARWSKSTPASISRRAGLPGTQAAQPRGAQPGAEGLGSPPARLRFEPNDHQTDALVTAAGMRALAADEPRAFAPPGLTPEIARTEGWTFGVL